jgi:hypothetical protein
MPAGQPYKTAVVAADMTCSWASSDDDAHEQKVEHLDNDGNGILTVVVKIFNTCLDVIRFFSDHDEMCNCFDEINAVSASFLILIMRKHGLYS